MRGFRFLLAILLASLLIFRPAATHAQSVNWANFVGTPGGPGTADGTGSAARFSAPAGVAVDSAGNAYVADSSNHTIRKITSAGVVTTLAGSPGLPGGADGNGATARFNGPFGVAVDASGNVYVADQNNHAIRKITSAGVVSTLAGNIGTAGDADGTGAAAGFNLPGAVAVDTAGNVYVSDSGNHTIRKITAGGVVVTLAGSAGNAGSADGTGAAATFNSPLGLAVSSAGDIYVADQQNYVIRKVTAAGVVTTFAGTAGSYGTTDGSASTALFDSPSGVAIDSSGNLYVSDSNNHSLRKITSSGTVSTLAGGAGTPGSTDSTGTLARFYLPIGVAANSSGIYVGDYLNNTVRKVTTTGTVTTLAGRAANAGFADGTGSAARFTYPFGVAADSSGNVYVSDQGNYIIRKITPAGVASTFAGTADVPGSADGTGTAASFSFPAGLASTPAGTIYVADAFSNTIRAITSAGVVTTLAGQANAAGSNDGAGSAARFRLPTGVALDASGNVYVADQGNHTIRMVTADGVVSTLAGQPGSPGSDDGPAAVARFHNPTGVAVDGGGNIFVADQANHVIRQITPGGVVSTLAGLAGNPGGADGTGSAARFRSPNGLMVDGSGNVYVADTGNGTIRKITAAGVVTTLGGTAGITGGSDGAGTAARFNTPTGMVLGGGFIYVSDGNENRIVKGTSVANIIVEQPAGNPLADNTGVVSFGTVTVGSPQTLTFVIRNDSLTNLTGLTITKDGTNSAEYTITQNPVAPVLPGGSTTLVVSFSPTAAGTRTAAIHITSNDPNKSPFDINLTANVIAPEIAIEQPAGTDLTDGSATALAYGSVLVGTQTLKTFTIRNTGAADLNGLGITINGTNPADYTVSQAPVAPVPPGGSTTFVIAFKPSATGARTASIHVANNDTNENPFDINLTGTGVAPDISIEQPANIALTDGVSSIAYGSSNIGTGVAKVFTVKNPGSYNLTGLSVTIDGANASDFTLTSGPTSPVAPAGNTTFTVTFNPTAAGARSASLHVASNVTGTKNPFDIALTGTGVTPEISVEQPVGTVLTDGVSTSSFAATVVNSTTVNTFTIKNLGSATLSGIAITKDGAHAADFTVGTVSTSVLAGFSTTFTVTFKPSTAGARTAAIHIASNDLDENPFDIMLSGTGTAPDISVEQPAGSALTDGTGIVPFDIVAVNATKALTFTVRNTGTASLTSLAITKDGTNSAEFTVGTPGATTLAAGATTTFTVTFKPTATGARTAAIHITSNVTGTKNPFDINLNGGLSGEAHLSSLAISQGTLSPAFSGTTNSYTATVANSITSLTVTPAAIQASATVRVNGAVVTSGSPSAAIPLAPGPNVITTVVTAQDGVTTQTYTLTVTRSAPYESWAQSQGLTPGNSGMLDNPDHDGMPNLLEYAFGTNPLSGDTGSMILSGGSITRRGGPFVMTSPLRAVFARRDDYLTSGLTYTVQFSEDMVHWTVSGAVPAVLADDGVVQAVSVPFPGGAKQFFRVIVAMP